MYKFNFSFSKTGAMKYISHLDLVRLFTRAMRRAQLPLKITQGFNPHPKLVFKRAIKLGVESPQEEAVVVLSQFVAEKDFVERLGRQLPQGIKIISGNILPTQRLSKLF